jgi:hypothetical protein
MVSVDAFQPVRFTPKLSDISLLTSGSFAVSLIYVGYAYSGWNAAAVHGNLELDFIADVGLVLLDRPLRGTALAGDRLGRLAISQCLFKIEFLCHGSILHSVD